MSDQKLVGKKILVVDDNLINLDVAVEALSSAGAQVDSAEGGADAIALIKSKAYDLLLLDLFMPEIDGIDVGKAARASQMNENTFVLLFTASDKEESNRAVKTLGAKGVIAKPVEIDDLIKKAEALF